MTYTNEAHINHERRDFVERPCAKDRHEKGDQEPERAEKTKVKWLNSPGTKGCKS
jgi:hypothetical protein